MGWVGQGDLKHHQLFAALCTANSHSFLETELLVVHNIVLSFFFWKIYRGYYTAARRYEFYFRETLLSLLCDIAKRSG